MLVQRVGVERDAVGGLRHVLADDPQAGGVLVAVHDLGEGRSPGAGIGEGLLTDAARGQGIGRQLLSALVAESEKNGIWTLQAGIFPEKT